jgi:uncharacterized LabA/DUF88 family protein
MSGVYVYIDGYNFYCGINQRGWLKYGWCNFSKLSKRLAERAWGSQFHVDEVKYYTAQVHLGREENKRHESERQKMWLDAVQAGTPEVIIRKGRWKKIGDEPREEKETDMNIGVDMQWDTVKAGRMILVSGDSDFIPAIRGARKARKPVVVFLPPNTDRYPPPEDCQFRIEQITKEDLTDCRLQERILVPGKPPILWSAYLNLRRQAGLSPD